MKEITTELTDYYHQHKRHKMGISPKNRNDTDVGQTLDENVDHVQRNTMLMAKYKEMSHIKSQINLDLMYQRLFHTH